MDAAAPRVGADPDGAGTVTGPAVGGRRDLVSSCALGAIHLYQRWVSPRKGYRCAFSVLHGGPGCSGFAKQAIREHGLAAALPDIRQRFRDCQRAAATVRAEHGAGNATAGRRNTDRRTRWYHWCDPGGCSGCAECAPCLRHADGRDCAGFDCSP